MNLPRLGGFVFVVALTLLATFVVRRVVHRSTADLAVTLQRLCVGLASAATLLIGAVLSFGVLGVPVLWVALGTSAASCVVALLLRAMLRQVAAGVVILWRQPFVVGDLISGAGQTGVVRTIDLHATTLVTDQGSYVIIPSTALLTSVVENHTPNAYNARRYTTRERRPRMARTRRFSS